MSAESFAKVCAIAARIKRDGYVWTEEQRQVALAKKHANMPKLAIWSPVLSDEEKEVREKNIKEHGCKF